MQQAASQGLPLLMKIDKTEQNRAFWENQFLKNKVKTTSKLLERSVFWGTEVFE